MKRIASSLRYLALRVPIVAAAQQVQGNSDAVGEVVIAVRKTNEDCSARRPELVGGHWTASAFVRNIENSAVTMRIKSYANHCN